MKHIHFIGIGGSGLSAIARVLLEKGYIVSGSDREASPLFTAITSAGARTFLGHAAEQINGADLVIRSSAVSDNNPEVIAANQRGIKVLKRADFLNELTAGKDTIAIAGSHGKTTTTAMVIWVLDQLGTNPSFISGGVINQLGCNAHSGTGPYFVIEADEYDYMFLGLSPKAAIITNIEYDHPDCFPTITDYREAFKTFLHKVQPDGLAILCFDNPETCALFEEMHSTGIQMLSYGLSPDSNYRIEHISYRNGLPEFVLSFQNKCVGEHLGKVKLNIPGSHNVLNATAALGIIHQLGLPITQAIDTLTNFSGVARRFDFQGSVNGILVIDDYGHHPTQITTTIEAARLRYPNHRIWAVWQPHTYSRTQILEDTYIQALNSADRVVILKIYSAREKDQGYSAEKIAESIPEKKASYIPNFDIATQYLLRELKPDDLLITFSAGDATKVSQQILEGLGQLYLKAKN